VSDYRAEIIEKAGAGPTINSLHSNRPLGGEKKKQPFSVRYTNRKSIRKSRFALSIKKVIQHPIGQAFHRNHKKFEPLVANAFLAVCNKIKSGIDLAELAKVVETRDLYRVIEMVAGDKFEKGLNGEFKKLIFEAYHAGALIGASQLKNAPVKKGGPGSGPRPGDGSKSPVESPAMFTMEGNEWIRNREKNNDYNDIRARQLKAEGLTTAVQNINTGTVTTAVGNEIHHEVAVRAEEDRYNKFREEFPQLHTKMPTYEDYNNNYTHGFTDKDGNFLTRAEADTLTGGYHETYNLQRFRGLQFVEKGGPGSGRYPAGSGGDKPVWTKNRQENISNAKAYIEGLGLPIKVTVVDMKDKEGKPKIYVPGAGGKTGIELNSNSDFWDDPIGQTDEKSKSGWWSTNDPMHFINHELGHVLYSTPDRFKGSKVENYSPSDARFRSVGVSRYAYDSPGEFVAEVHAGMQAGKSYDPRIMSVFNGLAKPNYPNIHKGGPGSGPHTTTGADRFKQILAYQRALENNKPALKHDISGEIVPAEGDEMHLDILDRIGGDARDWQEGFLTRDGRFVSRDQAESQLGFRTLAFKSFSGSLDLQNEDAVDYLRTELPTLIKEINNQQALAVQAVLLQGIHGGMDGPAIARQLKQVVGLTEKQAQWVINFRTQLMTGVNGNFTPVDERRLSAVDASMAQDQFEALEKDPATVDLLVDKYAASLTAKRAMDIAVSEIHSAEIQGQQEIWNKAVDLGYLDPDITRRMWGGIHDGKEREDHIATEDMNPDGVRIDEPFQTPIGEVMNPGDSGDDGFDDNCRCFVSLQFLDAWGKGAPNNEDQDSSTEEE